MILQKLLAAQETFLIVIINVENGCANSYFYGNRFVLLMMLKIQLCMTGMIKTVAVGP